MYTKATVTDSTTNMLRQFDEDIMITYNKEKNNFNSILAVKSELFLFSSELLSNDESQFAGLL